jgi:hypothetical protein
MRKVRERCRVPKDAACAERHDAESQGLYDFIQHFAPSIEELKVELSRIPSESPVLQVG